MNALLQLAVAITVAAVPAIAGKKYMENNMKAK